MRNARRHLADCREAMLHARVALEFLDVGHVLERDEVAGPPAGRLQVRHAKPQIDLAAIVATPELELESPAGRSREEVVKGMNRIMRPDAVAVIGASSEDGKIGNSVMKNLINGGYKGKIYPIHPKADEIMGIKAYKSVKDVPGEIDVAVFAIPAKFVAGALTECGEKGIPGAVLIPSGFAETGNVEGQEELQEIGRKYNIRLMGPNIYGFYYMAKNLCATFCTPFDVQGKAALSSQSGGIGMAIIGFSRSTKMGVSAIVGLGNKRVRVHA